LTQLLRDHAVVGDRAALEQPDAPLDRIFAVDPVVTT
jgi:hypothetical protein